MSNDEKRTALCKTFLYGILFLSGGCQFGLLKAIYEIVPKSKSRISYLCRRVEILRIFKISWLGLTRQVITEKSSQACTDSQ